MKGLDLSFSQPSQSWWNQRYAEGWRIMVQDAWTGFISPAPTMLNLNRARTAGFVTAAYVVVNDLPGATSVGHARYACGAEWDYLNFVAVDVEVPTRNLAIAGALKEIRRLGKKPCIYTSRNAWKTSVFEPLFAFRNEWLWNAYYDLDPDFDFFLNSYGGFTKLAGEQYQGTTNLDGFAVDLNNFSAAFIEEGSMPITAAEFNAMLKADPDFRAVLTKLNQVDRNANEAREKINNHLTAHPSGGVTIEQVRDELNAATVKAGE